nr:hypothetical protein HmN_000917700 [Hymenolepis microstoma]
MAALEELGRIIEVVQYSSCRHILKVANNATGFLVFDILINTGGYCMIEYHIFTPVKPKWTVVFGNKETGITSIKNYDFPIKATSLLEAFICCVYVVVNRFGMPMPSAVKQLDTVFYSVIEVVA